MMVSAWMFYGSMSKEGQKLLAVMAQPPEFFTRKNTAFNSEALMLSLE